MISFRSKVTQKILGYYFLNPSSKHYINELARILDEDPKNVDSKLKELEQDGLLMSEFQGKERFFSLNKKNPLLKHYRKIFLNTFGLEKQLAALFKSIKDLEEAYIFGSYPAEKMSSSSDIDVLAIGSQSALEIEEKITILQKKIGREINTVNLSPEEYKSMRQKKDPFIKNIFKNKTIKIK